MMQKTRSASSLPGALAMPAAATAACAAIILVAGLLAGLVPPGWNGNWTDNVVRDQAHFVDRFFPFDAVWYGRIAEDGYLWNPARPDVKQDVAFFPLWPMVLRLVSAWSGAPARWVVVALAVLFAFGSICVFHWLALKFFHRRSAGAATWLFALYPGASFLLLSYPTGLMNLLCVLAVLAAMRRRYWRAALAAGLVTAIGPLGLGTAMAVWVCAAVDRSADLRRLRAHPAQVVWATAGLAGLGVLAVSGLVGFLLWQWAVLGDTFAFIEAQGAWAAPLPWLARVPHALVQLLVVPDFAVAFAYLVHALHARTLVTLQAELEKGLQTAALGMALLMWLGCRRVVPLPVRLQGAFTLALFIWFHSTTRPGNSTLRLTYCVLTTPLGLAWILRDRPQVLLWAIGLSAAMLGCAAFLSAAGYHVV